MKRIPFSEQRCVICGDKIEAETGYIFYANGKKKTGATWCKQHLENIEQYANPIFENEQALKLFKKLHPRKFRKDVEGRQIVFLKKEEEMQE
jgi:hypothetical protein